ncbi:sigma-70 family RNA polymerase sigma factor [Neolewinella lacunae]|uniref:Sigma-70 family RNA polymerase sigma factor n=1 Tax=Neolewinella lacunae TaxID=1517758 RepID=A0A923TA38_9BACT|nr:sigma-70 family RNA polymerase sigma factor [Neolewinella lacunae]MBC6996161.1 sigma-70 family RNA polymerase sigma factor [Neolewinella lacunae]MDN3634012.1 sigma-70 family RNA polymerase sigma factor [Neolewinella lacunae]
MSKFLTEKELLGLLTGTQRERDRAFAEFFHNPYWITASKKFLETHYHADPHEATSAFNDALIAFDRQVRFRSIKNHDNARTYFFTILKRCLFRLRKGQEAKISLIGPAEELPELEVGKEVNVEELYIETENHLLLRRAISSLGQPCSKVLLMYHLGTKLKKIASLLEMASEDVAKTTLYRCRKKLLQYLRDHPGLH